MDIAANQEEPEDIVGFWHAVESCLPHLQLW